MQERERDDRSIATEIARDLGRRIVTGVIAPGEWLRQDHVAEEFRASHVPVREAFRRLEAQGLVQSEPRRGILEAVRAGDGEAAVKLLIAHIVEAGHALVRTL